jgi:hypothetical protein
MSEQSGSAFAAVRALRDEIKARLERNEDFRAWKALDDAIREMDPPSLPRAVELTVHMGGSMPASRVDSISALAETLSTFDHRDRA